MAVATFVPVEEYLSTSYERDCAYVEGRLVERNVGERDHGYLQVLIAARRDFRPHAPAGRRMIDPQ